MGLLDPLAFAVHSADHLHDPAAARPVRLDVIRCLFGSQVPSGMPTMPFLVILCGVWDLPLSMELAADLAMQGLLVPFDGQEHVGPLGEAPVKNDCFVCSAST